MSKPLNVISVGQTGAGKSELNATIARQYGGPAAASAFPSSSATESHTQEMVARELPTDLGLFRLNDGPGLLDTDGSRADERNIRKIVDHAKACGTLSAMLLVFNENNSRFDMAMQDVFKLLVSSFGVKITSNLAIVFTHSRGERTPEEARMVAQEICRKMEKCCGLPTDSLILPHFQVDCCPEKLLRLKVPEAQVEEVRSATRAAIQKLLGWAASTPPYLTTYAVYGEYESARLVREANERAAAEKKRADDLEVERKRLADDLEAERKRKSAEERRERDYVECRCYKTELTFDNDVIRSVRQVDRGGGFFSSRYRVYVTVNRSVSLRIRDESGDVYDLWCVRTGEHYVDYDSTEPAIVKVWY